MNKEILVSKWLDNTLSPQELVQFQQLLEYEDYVLISNYAHAFKAPDFDTEAAFTKILTRKDNKRNTPKLWVSLAAAIAILIAGAYFFTQSTSNTEVTTTIAQQETITLPDNSQVILNAMSSLSFESDTWENNRIVTLDGEAYFRVAKGSKFTVQTTHGSVSVLGTHFNVQERDEIFSVATFEGLVYVETPRFKANLPAGKMMYEYNDTVVERTLHSLNTGPSWLEKISIFDSAPYSAVIAEMERQYDITIKLSTSQTNALFTGSFTHTDLSQALETITIPMGLKFSVAGTIVTLEQE